MADKFTCFPNVDSSGGDIRNTTDRGNDTLAADCLGESGCKGYNIAGYLKKDILPLYKWNPVDPTWNWSMCVTTNMLPTTQTYSNNQQGPIYAKPTSDQGYAASFKGNSDWLKHACDSLTGCIGFQPSTGTLFSSATMTKPDDTSGWNTVTDPKDVFLLSSDLPVPKDIPILDNVTHGKYDAVDTQSLNTMLFGTPVYTQDQMTALTGITKDTYVPYGNILARDTSSYDLKTMEYKCDSLSTCQGFDSKTGDYYTGVGYGALPSSAVGLPSTAYVQDGSPLISTVTGLASQLKSVLNPGSGSDSGSGTGGDSDTDKDKGSTTAAATSSSSSLSSGAIAGIVIGIIAFIALVAVVIYWQRQRSSEFGRMRARRRY